VARTIADFTPHAWGNEAFSKLRKEGGGIGDVLPVGFANSIAASARPSPRSNGQRLCWPARAMVPSSPVRGVGAGREVLSLLVSACDQDE
jgi:hypothetical protein